jgi:DNA-binding PadR family transcriptional regulator
MEPRLVGVSEARVLYSLVRAMTIGDIADALEGSLDDAAVYITLKRLVDRGLARRKTVRREAADGKLRSVGEYQITAEGTAALDAFRAATAVLHHGAMVPAV